MTSPFLLPHLVLPRNNKHLDESVNKTLARLVEHGLNAILNPFSMEQKQLKKDSDGQRHPRNRPPQGI